MRVCESLRTEIRPHITVPAARAWNFIVLTTGLPQKMYKLSGGICGPLVLLVDEEAKLILLISLLVWTCNPANREIPVGYCAATNVTYFVCVQPALQAFEKQPEQHTTENQSVSPLFSVPGMLLYK